MISLADGKINTPGDIWHRNATLLCLDLTTALRIGDVLCLKHCDLVVTWNHNPLCLKIWLMDGKKDKWSSGMWSNEYHATAGDIHHDGINSQAMELHFHLPWPQRQLHILFNT